MCADHDCSTHVTWLCGVCACTGEVSRCRCHHLPSTSARPLPVHWACPWRHWIAAVAGKHSVRLDLHPAVSLQLCQCGQMAWSEVRWQTAQDAWLPRIVWWRWEGMHCAGHGIKPAWPPHRQKPFRAASSVCARSSNHQRHTQFCVLARTPTQQLSPVPISTRCVCGGFRIDASVGTFLLATQAWCCSPVAALRTVASSGRPSWLPYLRQQQSQFVQWHHAGVSAVTFLVYGVTVPPASACEHPP